MKIPAMFFKIPTLIQPFKRESVIADNIVKVIGV